MFSLTIMWIHLLAATAWIGGMLFTWFVLKPVQQKSSAQIGDLGVYSRIEERFKVVRWVSLVILLVTGVYSLIHEGDSPRMESDWGKTLMFKMLFVALALGLTGLNDFILSAGKNSPSTETSSPVKKGMNTVILVVALLIVWMAVSLRSR